MHMDRVKKCKWQLVHKHQDTEGLKTWQTKRELSPNATKLTAASPPPRSKKVWKVDRRIDPTIGTKYIWKVLKPTPTRIKAFA